MKGTNYLFDLKDNYCQLLMNKKLDQLVENTGKGYDRVSVVCIGTDRCTGDCYGPLVGSFLSRYDLFDFELMGTLHTPVHALNITESLSKLDTDSSLVIAVDSSLGIASHVGCIDMGPSPVRPGSGVGKNLPEVGDIHITGIVNTSGFLPMLVLQNTRLSLVYSMAEMTARTIQHVLYKRCKRRKITV